MSASRVSCWRSASPRRSQGCFWGAVGDLPLIWGLALLFSAFGCGPDLLANAPCPCVSGYFCCSHTKTCFPDGDVSCLPPPVETPLRLESLSPAEGPLQGGLTITVTGEGFSDTDEVTIGGALCEDLQLQSSREIRCLQPPGAERSAAVDVSVFARNGEQATLRRGFRYVPRPFTNMTPLLGLGPGTSGSSFSIADLNSDGQPDIYFSAATNTPPRLFFNRGDFRFELQSSDWLFEQPKHVASVVADFTGDNRADVMLMVNKSEHVSGTTGGILLVNQGNSLGAIRSVPQPGFLDSATGKGVPRLPVPLDFDGDGDVDLIGGRDPLDEEDNPFPWVLALNDEGVLTEAPQRVETRALAGAVDVESIAAGDLNRDGIPEIVGCGYHLFLMRSLEGRLVDVTRDSGLPTEELGFGCDAVGLHDLDSDGDLDIAIVPDGNTSTTIRSDTRSGIVIYWNQSDASALSFERAEFLETDSAAFECPRADHNLPGASLRAGATKAVFADLDHDSDIDIFLPRPFWTCVESPLIYRNLRAQGTAAFAVESQPTLGTYGAFTSGTASDIDGDHDLDIVVFSWGSSTWGFFRNNLMESAGSSAGPKGQFLTVEALTGEGAGRPAYGVTVELDLDGPEESPDFLPGPGKLLIRTAAMNGGRGQPVPKAHFGFPERTAPVWLKTRFADGSITVVRVDSFDRSVTLRDCDAPLCD